MIEETSHSLMAVWGGNIAVMSEVLSSAESGKTAAKLCGLGIATTAGRAASRKKPRTPC